MKHSLMLTTATYQGIPTLPANIMLNCSRSSDSKKVLRQFEDDYLNKEMPFKEAVENARLLSLRLEEAYQAEVAAGS